MISGKLISAICYVLFAPLIGGLIDGIGRKISARMQRRVGPPLLQPFYDLGKLLHKDPVHVAPSQNFFMMSYLFFIVMAGGMMFLGMDILMCMFVLSTAVMFLYFAAVVTGSHYSSIGASRELLQMVAYEPCVLLTCVAFYLVRGSFETAEIIKGDISPIVYLPGVFVAFIFILTIKMRKSPFDISTSHHPNQEIVKGITSEIGSRNFGIYTLAEWYETVFLLGMVALFIINSNPWSILAAVAVIALVYFLEILIDNTSARVKSDVMIKVSWAVTLVAAGFNILVLIFFLG